MYEFLPILIILTYVVGCAATYHYFLNRIEKGWRSDGRTFYKYSDEEFLLVGMPTGFCTVFWPLALFVFLILWVSDTSKELVEKYLG